MNGFLSDGVRDLISIVGLILAIAGFFTTLLPPKSKREKWNSVTSETRKERGRSVQPLHMLLLEFLESPTDDGKIAIRVTIYYFLAVVVSYISMFYVSETLDICVYLACLAATFVEISAFMVILAESKGWIEQNFEGASQSKLWQAILTGSWMSSLILGGLFLRTLQPPVSAFFGFVALHIIVFMLVSFFALCGIIG